MFTNSIKFRIHNSIWYLTEIREGRYILKKHDSEYATFYKNYRIALRDAMEKSGMKVHIEIDRLPNWDNIIKRYGVA